MIKMSEEYPVHIGFYIKFTNNDEIQYLTEGTAYKIPNSNVFVSLNDGVLWFYTGKKLELEMFYS